MNARFMQRTVWLALAVVTAAGVVTLMTSTAGRADDEGSPIYGVKIPAGYREWRTIAVNQLLVPGKTDQLRAQLGNDIAFKAFKDGTLPFPDGAVIVALHWTRVPSEYNNQVLAGAFPGAQSFVVGSRVNMQIMVKDSKKMCRDRRLGIRRFQGRQTGRRSAAQNLLPVPRAGQRSRLRFYALRAVKLVFGHQVHHPQIGGPTNFVLDNS